MVAVGGAASSSTALSPAISDGIMVPRAQLQQILDHLGRAEHAARQCSRVSQAASNAFMEEANGLASVKVAVESLLVRSGP